MKNSMEKTYKIVFRKSAEKQLLKLPRSEGRIILNSIAGLATEPFPDSARKMHGFENVFRLRIRNYRVIYRLEKKRLIVEIIKIGHRQNIYK